MTSEPAVAVPTEPDALPGALILVAAVAGLVWALAAHGSNDGNHNVREQTSLPDTPKDSRARASQADYF